MAPKLSANDSTVLAQIFDPESAPSPSPILIESSLPPFPNTPTNLLPTLQSTERLAINFAESSDFTKSLSVLSDLILSHPTYPSAYNNRAQVHRLSILFSSPSTMDNLLLSPTQSSVLSAYNDLTRAIELASPTLPTSPVSPQQAKLLANAYTQRATIIHVTGKYALANKDLEMNDEVRRIGGDGDWEERASRDFFLGGRYGNEVAKAMAVHTNPYAKLCGNIVKEAMKKEMEGLS